MTLASAVGPSSHGVRKTKWSLAASAAKPQSRAASTVSASRASDSGSSPNGMSGRWTPSSIRPCSYSAGTCWVMQWTPPPPRASVAPGTGTASRPGNSDAISASASGSVSSPLTGTISPPLQT